MSNLPEFVMERVFDAPRELVWRAWTDPRLVQKWYGPNVESTIHQYNLTVNGEWHNEMKWGGNSKYEKMVFQTITPPEKLVWHHYSSTNSQWETVSNPMMPDWPNLLLTTVTFGETDGQTTVRLSQIPMNASEAEISCFAEMMANMSQGWGSGYKIIDTILQDLQA